MSAALVILVAASSAGADTLIPSSSNWKYDDTGTDLGAAWREPAYDDAAWLSGPAQLGFGQGDEATVLSFGGDAEAKHPTYYFRTSFDVADPSRYERLTVRVLRDHGCAAYMNGVEVLRSNLPEGPLGFSIWASTSSPPGGDTTWHEFEASPSLLLADTNVLAVEVHLAGPASPDLSLDLELIAIPKPVILKGPYLQRPTETSIVVRWETDAATLGLVEYGSPPAQVRPSPDDPVTLHGVSVEGLLPGTRYDYRVSIDGNGVEWTPWLSFRTAPAAGEAFRFAVYGDSQEFPAVHAAVAGAILASDPDLVLHTGDLVTLGMDYAVWEPQFFGPARDLMAVVPLVPAVGNHEYLGSGQTWFFDFFARYGDRPWTAYTYGCARFIALDTNLPYAPGSEQGAWLLAELESQDFASASWRFAYFHHPAYTCTSYWPDDPGVGAHLVPLFETYGVDMVFSGHAHIYERFWKDGVYYIVTGGGGGTLATLNTDTTPPIRIAGERSYHHCVIDVSPEAIVLEPRRNDGSAIETVVIPRDSTPPVLSEVLAIEIGKVRATIAWTTDEPADSTVEYGTDPDYGGVVSLEGLVLAHAVVISGLEPATTYHYRVASADSAGNVATGEDLTFETLPANRPPVAEDGTWSCEEDGTVAIVLSASDPDGDAISYRIVTPPARGSLSGEAPSLTYMPDPDSNGPDAFTFAAGDGTVEGEPASVSIAVSPVNDPPVASGGNLSSPEDQAAAVTLSASDVDGDPLEFRIVRPPVHGTLGGSGAERTYLPDRDYVGPDSFTYAADDGALESEVATVAITVTPENDAPVAFPGSLSTAEDSPATAMLVAVDVDGDALQFRIVTPPSRGSLSGSGPALTYTPDPDSNGPDAFAFAASDGTVESEVATVSITVSPVNDAPVALPGTVSTAEDRPTDILLSATDADGDPLEYRVVTPPSHGELSGSGANLTYAPDRDYHGPDLFTFRAGDGTAESEVATVSIEVTPVNDAPAALPGSISTVEDRPTDILLSATDADGDPLEFRIATPPSHGELSGSGAALTYAPAGDYHGPDAFTFVAGDGVVESEAATVSIEVTPVNDAPAALPGSVSTLEDEAVSLTLVATDVDGDGLEYRIVSPPSRGSLSGPGPVLTYTPDPDSHGPDLFTFRAGDGTAESEVAAVSISVAPVNDRPAAFPGAVSTDEDQAASLTLVATDVDGDPLEYRIVTPPSDGMLSGSGPDRTYTPNPDYHGADGFVFVASDGTVESDPATVAITIGSDNDAPVALDGAATTPEDLPVTLPLPATDVDGDALEYRIVSPPSHGILSGEGPTRTYAPARDYHGPDSFSFRAGDGEAESDVATIAVEVTPVNDPPVAFSGTLGTAEDAPAAVALIATDVDGDPLEFRIETPPSHGTLTGSGANLTYAPAGDHHGPDAFTFHASDGTAESDAATVSIAVSPVNDRPAASPGSLVTAEDSPAAVALAAEDIDGDPLGYRIVTPPSHGTLSGSGADLTYTPDRDYHGPDGFTFAAGDGSSESDPAAVSIQVTPVNDPPVAFPGAASTAEDGAAAITLIATDIDGDALEYRIVTAPSRGTLSGSGAALTYTPDRDSNGPDGFEFRASDGSAESDAATVSIAVAPVNDAPVALDGIATTAEDEAATIPLEAADADGDALEYRIVTAPSHGTLSGSGAALTYAPVRYYHGPDGFTFRAGDGAAESGVATVSIAVTPVNDAPVALDGTATTVEDEAVGIRLAATDVDGDALEYRIVTAPTHGTLSGSGAALTYTPVRDYNGPDGFTFRAGDGAAESDYATVSIAVTPVNDAPVALDGTVTTAEDEAVSIPLEATDADGDVLEYRIVTAPSHGTLNGSGAALTYAPARDYNGPDGFTFRAGDGAAESGVAKVSITVTPVNDPPVVLDGTVTTFEDEAVGIALIATDVDGDRPALEIVSHPLHGIISGVPPEITYTPEPDYHGPDGLRFIAMDASGASAEAAIRIEVLPVDDPPLFIRGDASDDGRFNLTDPIVTLEFLFMAGDPLRCPDGSDVDDNGRIDITDPIVALSHLFLGIPAPLLENLACAPDPTADMLGECESATCPQD
jgi:hypothetical protein